MEEANYQKIRDAADARVYDESGRTWELADALADAFPQRTRGGDQSARERALLDDQLADVADRLKLDGRVTPQGEVYTPEALEHLRRSALRWPEAKRHREAAFRTHQEARGPEEKGGKVLAALCGLARGVDVRRPRDVEVAAWDQAVEQVRRAVSGKRTRRYLVSANTLRIALGDRPNVPGPSRGITPDDVAKLPAQAQVAIASRVLSNPQTAQHVMRDPQVRRSTSQAHLDVVRSQTPEQMDRARQAREAADARTRPARDLARSLEIDDLFARSRNALTKALERLREGSWDDDERGEFLEQLELVQLVASWVESYLRQGDESWDQALEKLMNEGG